MLIPDLPAYLTSLGGAEYKGLIIGLFALTAGLSRPFSGKLTDKIGRVPVMAVGSLVCVVCGLLLLRLIHGFSTGFKPTATSAYVADAVPPGKWGEAMGIHSLFFSTGMAIGPAIGSAITQLYSIDVLFYCSSLFALFSIVIIFNMKETLKDKEVFTIASLLIRFVAGKASDRYGRKVILKVSIALLFFALLWIATFQTVNGFLIGAVLYGIATGMLSPAVSAWTIDLSDADKRGLSVATMYIALEAGIGLGAFFSGWFVSDKIGRTPIAFYAVAFINLIGLAYLFLSRAGRQNETLPIV